MTEIFDPNRSYAGAYLFRAVNGKTAGIQHDKKIETLTCTQRWEWYCT